MKCLFRILILFLIGLHGNAQNIVITGSVIENGSGNAIQYVSVKVSNTTYLTQTNKNGFYSLSLPERNAAKIIFSHLSYNSVTKNIKRYTEDTLQLNVALSIKVTPLDSVSVFAVAKPETLVGKPDYSIFDFDFYEDKLILLGGKSLTQSEVQLSDYNGKVHSSFRVPKKAGSAQYFFHDYEGYSDLVCKDSIFRVDVINSSLLVYPIGKNDFEKNIVPVSDTAKGHYYYSDRWDKYPAMNYYSLKKNDTLAKLLKNITNADLMKLYNLEYFYLPSRMQLEARRLAVTYKVDEKVVAALMSGFTQSMYFEPLYAPLFILKDTICIFNHHNDHLFHYNKNNQLIDSVKISYHHPKNWREWKKQLFVDDEENKVYASFSKDGHHYLKEINYQTGKEVLTYKLKHHSAEKIRIKNGYVYYIYRPFDSTQEKFLYRERIIKNEK